MILDSSAIVSFILREEGHEGLVARLDATTSPRERRAVGAPTLVETSIVLSHRMGQDSWPLLLAFLRWFSIEVVQFSPEHSEVAHEAFLKFGKGRHPARLNFGDCLSYAVAKVANEPLLFTGNDFRQTDLRLA